MERILRTGVIGILLCFFLSASGQVPFSVSGSVINKEGGSLAGATVMLLNSHHAAVADSSGQFAFGGLLPGKYIFKVSFAGYATALFSEPVFQSGRLMPFVLHPVSEQLEEVVVTSGIRQENLQQLPFSIHVFNEQQVRSAMLWNMEALSGIVPNLYSANPGDDRNVVSIRGITTTSYDPAVSVYIDGVNQFGLDTYISPLWDIERIEILKGPQGTLYGRNALGGVINVITKKPADQFKGFAEAVVGNFGQQRYELATSLPLVPGKWYAGAAMRYQRLGGFYRNEFDNKPFDQQQGLMGNYFVKFNGKNNWQFLLNLKHNNQQNHGAFPLSTNNGEAGNLKFTVNQDARARMMDRTMNTSLVINHPGSRSVFSAQTAFQSNHRYYDQPLDGDFSPVDGVSIINNFGRRWNTVKVVTQEIKFTSPAQKNAPVEWVSGMFLFYQDNPVKQGVHFGRDAALVGAPDTDFMLLNTQRSVNYGAAVFAQANYLINDRWVLIGGLRMDAEHKKAQVLGQYVKDPDPQPLFDTRPDTSAARTFTAFSPKAGIQYLLSPTQQFYLTYSKGFRTGGLTPLSGDPSQPPLFAFAPEYSHSLEWGLRNEFFEKRMRLNASLFFTKVNGIQVPTLVMPDAVTITKNAGKLISKGAEIDITAMPLKRFSLFINGGFADARYQSLKIPGNGQELNLDGNRQVFTPRNTFSIAGQYGIPVTVVHAATFILRADWNHRGKTWFDLNNSIAQEAYGLLNARAGIEWPKGEVFIWGKNLSNARYIAYAYDFGAIHLGNPLTCGISLRRTF